MVGHIIGFDNFICDILVKRQLITPSQIANLKLIQTVNNLSFIEIIIQEGIIENETLIEILHKDYNIELVNNTSKLRIINYTAIDEYAQKGYFVYKNCDDVEYIAINNLKILHILSTLDFVLNKKIKITLVKNKISIYFLKEILCI